MITGKNNLILLKFSHLSIEGCAGCEIEPIKISYSFPGIVFPAAGADAELSHHLLFIKIYDAE